jgi:diaminohydroxyphosphoribosylaminopyrimidine deaminase / 5-amino-6-(5-phosphoribosylamino)uracil reductase
MPNRADHAAFFAPFEAGTRARPFVVAQLGQSLDGRIATLTGDSKYINRGAALAHLHAIRAHVDAVVVGIGTVLADDPLLTVRLVEGKSPARIIIDPSGRIPVAAKCLTRDGVPSFVVCKPEAELPHGITTFRIATDNTKLCSHAIIRTLGEHGFRRILIEGGAQTISHFIDAGCVDRLHVLVAPMIIGSGKPALDLKPIHDLQDALRPRTRTYILDDGDVLFDCDLRSPA